MLSKQLCAKQAVENQLLAEGATLKNIFQKYQQQSDAIVKHLQQDIINTMKKKSQSQRQLKLVKRDYQALLQRMTPNKSREDNE